ncbi:MAG: hypothetical protein AB9891_02005 [Anaerolineaceae bacterium]
MLSFTTSMIIAVVCVIVGLGIGMLISMAMSNRGNENTPPSANPYAPYKRVATLLRDPKDSSLLTETDGRIFASAEPLNDSQHEMLEETARDWYAWLRLPPEPEDVIPPADDSAPRKASGQSKTIPLAEFSKVTPKARPGSPRAGGMVPPLVAAAVASNVEKRNPAAARSIVEQIDEILQDMVAGTPLAEKSIRLVEEPNSGVIVWIGLEHFEGINNVPDIEARTIIQAAVREWEKRSEVKPNNRAY